MLGGRSSPPDAAGPRPTRRCRGRAARARRRRTGLTPHRSDQTHRADGRLVPQVGIERIRVVRDRGVEEGGSGVRHACGLVTRDAGAVHRPSTALPSGRAGAARLGVDDDSVADRPPAPAAVRRDVEQGVVLPEVVVRLVGPGEGDARDVAGAQGLQGERDLLGVERAAGIVEDDERRPSTGRPARSPGSPARVATMRRSSPPHSRGRPGGSGSARHGARGTMRDDLVRRAGRRRRARRPAPDAACRAAGRVAPAGRRRARAADARCGPRRSRTCRRWRGRAR